MIRSVVKQLLEPLRKNGILDVPTAVTKGRVHETQVNGKTVRWLIANRNDEIQRKQIADGYYERAELDRLRSIVGDRAAILDIGANIGNHAIYFANHLNCERITLIEPYQPAIEHLMVNLALNFSPCFNLGHLGKAVGAKPGSAEIGVATAFNIGIARLEPDKSGSIAVMTGDSIVRDEPIDLIKVDVEGMELDVIEGLGQVFTNQRPALYIEVNASNRQGFLDRMERIGYRVAEESSAYGSQSNFTMLPD